MMVWRSKQTVGRVLGNMTGLQAIYRTLKVGETRATLAAKCVRGMRRKKHTTMDPKLAIHLQAVSSGSGQVVEDAKQ